MMSESEWALLARYVYTYEELVIYVKSYTDMAKFYNEFSFMLFYFFILSCQGIARCCSDILGVFYGAARLFWWLLGQSSTSSQ